MERFHLQLLLCFLSTVCHRMEYSGGCVSFLPQVAFCMRSTSLALVSRHCKLILKYTKTF